MAHLSDMTVLPPALLGCFSTALFALKDNPPPTIRSAWRKASAEWLSINQPMLHLKAEAKKACARDSYPTNQWYTLSDQYGQIIRTLGFYLTLICPASP
jgi:hypothetical protein